MSSHIPFVIGATVSHTIANPGPTEFPAGGAQFNRRILANLSNRSRARIYVGAGTDGITTSEETVEYTTDLTGASGWIALGTYDDGATGPLVSGYKLQNVGTAWGPWCTTAVGARGLVLLRVRGRNGDGATAINIQNLGVEVAGNPRHAGMSLAGATPGRVIAMFGGSQIGGGGTVGTGVGEFGQLAVGLRSVPSGSTLYLNGSTVTLQDHTDHGAEAGVLAQLADSGKSADLVCRYVEATVAADWTDTHLATLAADVITAGKGNPAVCFYVGGGNDGQALSRVGAYDYELRRLRGRIEALWPGCVLVWMPQVSHDPVENPFLPEARVVFKRRLSEPYDGKSMWVTNEPTTSTELQADDRHPTSVGEVSMGRRFAAAAVSAGIFG